MKFLIDLLLLTQADSCVVKKMKFESTTQQPIQIFEFQAYSAGVNVAALGSAMQSSLFNDNERFTASKAIDGMSSTFSHTKSLHSWLEIDLTAPLDIKKCCHFEPLVCGSKQSNGMFVSSVKFHTNSLWHNWCSFIKMQTWKHLRVTSCIPRIHAMLKY